MAHKSQSVWRYVCRSEWVLAIVSALIAVLCASVASTSALAPQVARARTTHVVLPADDSEWRVGPDGMPAGSRFAIISGEPMQAAPYLMRVELPAGYAIPPYRRSRDENIIVLAGAIEVGSGAHFEPGALRVLPAGSMVTLRADEAHFLRTQEGATVQIFGQGPFTMEYLERR